MPPRDPVPNHKEVHARKLPHSSNHDSSVGHLRDHEHFIRESCGHSRDHEHSCDRFRIHDHKSSHSRDHVYSGDHLRNHDPKNGPSRDLDFSRVHENPRDLPADHVSYNPKKINRELNAHHSRLSITRNVY